MLKNNDKHYYPCNKGRELLSSQALSLWLRLVGIKHLAIPDRPLAGLNSSWPGGAEWFLVPDILCLYPSSLIIRRSDSTAFEARARRISTEIYVIGSQPIYRVSRDAFGFYIINLSKILLRVVITSRYIFFWNCN